MEVIPPERAKTIPRSKIFRIPLRWVRVNKNKDLQGVAQLIAKSRLVLPGHADPHLGDFRTDAPTTTLMAVRVLKSVAMTKSWALHVFDVTTAFLSGNKTSREVYVKGPESGLPAARGVSALPPFTLLRILKNAYGLAEAPRLWYLKACQQLEDAGMKELPFARATFIMEEAGVTQAACTLHVDDGMLGGDAKSPAFKALLDRINKRFNIKEWKLVGEKPLDFLGCQVFLRDGRVVDSMVNYVIGIAGMKVTQGDEPLDEKQRTAFRSLVQRLRWPAQQVFPEQLFAVSDLAQCVTTATMAHARKANKLLEVFQVAAKEGLMEFEQFELVSFFDASLGKTTSNRAQQGQVHFLTTSRAHKLPTPANILSFRSAKITRVVKSSLAAEGNALSAAADEQLYLRLLVQAFRCGMPTVTSQWKEELRYPGTVVTDAKALYDHLLKTGHMTAERQTMLDILAAKQLIESACMKVAWVPTFRQFADGLTKEMLDELFLKFKSSGEICLVETAEDQVIEAKRSALRRAQRDRRKIRMKAHTSTSSPSDVPRSVGA